MEKVRVQERRKQQIRFKEGQSIQWEMSQLEKQCEESEEYGQEIMQQLRASEGSQSPVFPLVKSNINTFSLPLSLPPPSSFSPTAEQEDKLMKEWLQLVDVRNGLIGRITEISFRFNIAIYYTHLVCANCT